MRATQWSILVVAVLLANLASQAAAQCKFSVDGYEYDLTPLMGQTYSAHNTKYPAYTENLAVCGEVVSTSLGCAATAAVCETSTNSQVKMTIATNPVTVTKEGDNIIHKYSIAPPSCYQIKITFTCVPDGGKGTPTYVSETSCSMDFIWATKHACPVSEPPPPDPCKFSADGTDYDLTPLKGQTYSAQNALHPDFTEHLAVCGELVTPSIGCPSNTAVCETSSTDSKLKLSIGTIPVTVTKEGENIIHTYATPSTSCMVVKITFTCDHKAGKGAPKYMSESKCSMDFIWATQYVCSGPPPSDSCKFSANGTDYDLTPLMGQTYSVKNGKYSYYIEHLAVCGEYVSPSLNCTSDAAVCESDTQSMPVVRKTLGTNPITIVKSGDAIIQTYTVTPPHCLVIQITFTCDPRAGKGEPKFVSEETCAMDFSWPTQYACAQA